MCSSGRHDAFTFLIGIPFLGSAKSNLFGSSVPFFPDLPKTDFFSGPFR